MEQVNATDGVIGMNALPVGIESTTAAFRIAGAKLLACPCLFAVLILLWTDEGQAQQTSPLRPSVRSSAEASVSISSPLPASLFSSASGKRHGGPATDFVLGEEATQLRAFDVGNFLDQSLNTKGVVAHKRTTIANDVRIRGSRAGQNIGAGSLWNPGRQDLDTALNKIFAYNIDHLAVIKGPYSVRYGPGFNFVDMQFLKSARGARSGLGWRHQS